MSRSSPSEGILGSPTSDMPMIGHGFGLSWQKRWNVPASFSGRIARLPWTKPLATPAVVADIPARQSSRACRLGRTSRGPPCSFLARPTFIEIAPSLGHHLSTGGVAKLYHATAHDTPGFPEIAE